MRKVRALTWALILTMVLAGAAPQAVRAQDGAHPSADPGTGSGMDSGTDPGQSMLYLPALHTGSPVEHVEGGLVTAAVPKWEQDVAAAFWTREKMQAAKPLDLLVVNQVGQAAEGWRDVQRVGRKGSAAGVMPDSKAMALAKSLYAGEWARVEADEALNLAIPGVNASAVDETDAYAATPPFTSYYINDSATTWKNYPWIAMGRLFYQIPGLTGTYACSGAVAHGRAVLTAGHCIYTVGRGWSYNMWFVPAYRNGIYPYGSFAIKNRTVLSQWVSTGNLAYDIGMVAVDDRNGLKLSQWVGSLGFVWNQPATQLFHAFGYPSNYASGQYLVTCAASTYERDPLSGPDPIGIGCNMGSGASGGPWLVAYAPFKGGATNYINGLVSYGYSTKPLEVYGPYFGDEAKLLYDWGTTQ